MYQKWLEDRIKKPEKKRFRTYKMKGEKVRFESWCVDFAEMAEEIVEAEKLGLRTKMLKGELFREVKK